jgi:hypothetical protein
MRGTTRNLQFGAGHPTSPEDIPLQGGGLQFGLRNGTRLTNWWTAAKAVVTPVYTSVSTEANCATRTR